MKKKYYLILILLIGMFGCDYSDNDKLTIAWIDSHQKPIICVRASQNGFSMEYSWTLQSVDNKFYQTGWINLRLPDTIHAVKIEDIMDTLMITHSKKNGF